MDKYFPNIDLLHATDCVFPPLRGAKVVMTVHDLSFLIFPQYHKPLNRLNLRLALPMMSRRADAVIVDSENTRRDLVRLRRVPDEKIHVIPLGVGERYQPVKAGQALPVLAARYGIREPYLLFVGTLEPRKNLIGLLEVYENLKGALNCQLVIVGKQGWHSESFYSRLRASSACDKVILTGSVPEEDLPLLYSSALLFVYPSFYEGFGLPVLEAMACGLPVVCSNTSSLPEVVGESAVLVDPSDVRLLAEAIRRVIENKELRTEMRAKGLEKARQFTWERTARSTLEVYHKVLSAGNA